MDTSDEHLAYITKGLSIQFPGIMADGAFARVDNIANEAVTRGLIAQRPNFRFPNYHLFENVQSSSANGRRPTATNESAYYMLHMAYDHTVPHGNTTTPVGCIAAHPPTAGNLAGYPI
jgi:hypothetical protein